MRRSPAWLVRDPVARSGLLFVLVAAVGAAEGTWAAAGLFGAVAALLLAWGRHRWRGRAPEAPSDDGE